MKLKADQLAANLAKSLAPVYVVSGDEPLQLSESLDQIRASAKAKGYSNRELFYAESGFDWGLLLEAAGSFSLFGEQKILDVRLTGKPDKEGAAALEKYAKSLPEDAILLLSLPKLSANDQKAAWFQALESKGVLIQVWPLEGQNLLHWLEKRLAEKGMIADRSGLNILAARVEGNLLAAAQELEKLHILYGAAKITDEMIRKAVADNARYDIFDLTEAALSGQVTRTHRILEALKGEGVANAVVLWALARELRYLTGLKSAMATGCNLETAFIRQREKVWDKRKNSLATASQKLSLPQLHEILRLCAQADRIIKGQEGGNAWDLLLDIALRLCGINLTPGVKP